MSAHPVDIHVGKRLRFRRSILGMSQQELGKSVGVTFQQVQKYERGLNRIGSGRLYDISVVLDVPVNFFFDDMDGKSGIALVPGFAEKGGDKFKKEELSSKETLGLVRAYYKISDPKIRKKVLGLIKAMSSVDNDN